MVESYERCLQIGGSSSKIIHFGAHLFWFCFRIGGVVRNVATWNQIKITPKNTLSHRFLFNVYGDAFFLFFFKLYCMFLYHDLQFLPVKQAVFGQNFPKEKGLGAFANLLVGSSATKAGNKHIPYQIYTARWDMLVLEGTPKIYMEMLKS